MAHHWLLFLVGATFLQGAVLLSPTPLADEEWESYNSFLRDPAYRLPTTTTPVHYELSLTPYLDVVAGPNAPRPFSFEGSVTIQIIANVDNITEIVMHCNDLEVTSVLVSYLDADNATQEIATANQTLECQMPYSFLRISTDSQLESGRTYTVNLEFTGNLQTNMRGFYRSWYVDSSGVRRWMATTQFQPGNARQAFPCYDEPGFKATFDITINRDPSFSPTLSNMPIRAESNTTVPGRISETFHTTPKTSTYLLAFIVSHYIEVAASDDVERPFQIFARDNAGTTGDWSLEIGVALLKEMENYTQIAYYSVAPYMDMKQAAIPDFSAGAMENWGLLTYREALILYDPVNSNHFYKQRVANIVSHEIAHMWFGNLVTCAWWDNLWLNEGFARFYQYYLTAKVAPELGYETRFVVEQFSDAMASDSVDSAHALTNPNVNDPTSVTNHFSVITYARGACILRMTQHLLGEDTYVKGLREYLNKRSYDVAVPEDLFEALDNAAVVDSALSDYDGITIDRYFRTWSEKAGHPLLTVNIDQESGNITITQARWERDTGVSLHNELWDIPITWTRAGDADFEDLKPSQFITQESTTIDRGTNESEWVIFNKQASGFYRINYDLTNWGLITQALRSNVSVIHEYNRAQIIDDLFAFGRAGVLSYDRVLNIISFLEFDDQYAPWITAIRGFNFLVRRLAHDADNLIELQDVIHQLSGAIADRLGYVERDNESYMDGLLRMYVMQFLCNVEHTECLNTGRQYFTNWINGGFVPANMRPWVYCTGLRDGNATDFDTFWDRYLSEDLASEHVVMLQAAGCTTNNASLVRLLELITDEEEFIRPQDINTALNSAVTGNEDNTLRVLEWLKNNVNRTAAKLGSIATPLSYITPRLLTTNDINELENWLQENEALIGPSAFQTGNNGVVSARNNLVWSAERTEELEQYFETGYVDGAPTEPPTTTEITTEPPTTTELPDTTTEPPTTTEVPDTTVPITEAPTTEEPTTPGDGDGAATIAVSLVALSVSFAVAFLN